MKIGDKCTVSRRYSVADIARYQVLSGAEAIDGDIVPEPLIGALFSYLLGVELPGFGTNYLKQDLHFLSPAPLDEELTASVEVTRLRPDKHLVDLETVCRTEGGTEICRGRALVLVKDVS